MNQREYRKHKDNLVTSGFAVIIFGVWNVMRMIMRAITNTEAINNLINAAEGLLNEFTVTLLIVMMALIMTSFILLFMVYIGVSARLEGKGKRKGYLYVILAVVLLVLEFLNTLSDLLNVLDETYANVERISLLLDFAALYAITTLVRSIYKVRKYERMQR